MNYIRTSDQPGATPQIVS